MAQTRGEAAQRLLEAFSRFRRVNWHQIPGVGLRPREIMALNLVRTATPGGAGITISEISDATGVTSPTVTQLINSLEAEGYVERGADPSDRRAVRIVLTPKGETALQSALDAFFAAFDGLVGYLGEEDSLALARLLSRVFDYFSK